MSKSLRIELQSRPGNKVMEAMFSLMTCVFGSAEKELAYEQGGCVLIIEDSPENINTFLTALVKRSWDSPQFEAGRRDPHFEMGMSAFGGQEKWSEFLNKVIGDMIVSVTVT